MKHSKLWSPENLKSLIDSTGIVMYCLSDSTKIPVSTIQSYLRGRSTPSIDALVTFADFFDVPLDFLCGRYSLEDSKKLVENYSENFMKLRRVSYEKYLIHTNHSQIPISRHVEIPWPYNLLKAINIQDWDGIYTEDQMNGLNKAINMLSERDQRVIRMYFEKGMRFEDVGKAEGVTGSRAREIAVRAVKYLRRPDRLNLITKGVRGTEQESQYAKMISKIREDTEKAESDYQDFLHSIYRRKKELEKYVSELEKVSEGSNILENELKHYRNSEYPAYSATIYQLDLSARSVNCLTRARILTVEDIVKAERLGQLTKVSGLGKKSHREILSRIDPEFLR